MTDFLQIFPMMQKKLLRVFLWENCFLNVAMPVFELWRGKSGSIVVELQDVLRKKSAFHCRGHWAARLHSEAERYAPGATHLSCSRLQCGLLCSLRSSEYEWQLRVGIPIPWTVATFCVTNQKKKSPMRNWKLQMMLLFLWPRHFFLYVKRKSGSQAPLNHCELGCGISSWSSGRVLPVVNLCFTITILDMTASAS